MLRQFDRKLIRAFLKQGPGDGTEKNATTTKLKDVYVSNAKSSNPMDSSRHRPGTAPSGLLRKEANLTDTPQQIANGEISSQVAVQKGARVIMRKPVNADVSLSPYAKPLFPNDPRSSSPTQLHGKGQHGLRGKMAKTIDIAKSLDVSSSR